MIFILTKHCKYIFSKICDKICLKVLTKLVALVFIVRTILKINFRFPFIQKTLLPRGEGKLAR